MSPRRTQAGARRTPRRPRRCDESGTSIVEFVLVLPVFAALLLGMLSAGIAYDHKQELTNAAEEAARYGSTLPIAQCDNVANCSGMTWAQVVQSVALAASNGTLTSSQICAALVSGPGDAPVAYDSTHTTAGDASPCFVDNSADSGYRVQVSVTRSDSLNAFFFSKQLAVSAKSIAIYEEPS